MRTGILFGILSVFFFAAETSGQVRIEGWHVYPELKKCPERVQWNGAFDVSVALPSVWTKEQVSQITFEWTVSAGRITAGQGTESITVATGPDAENITASVDMKGPMFPNVSESCIVSVDAAPQAVLRNEFTFSNQQYLEKILYGFSVDLGNEPAARAYIVVYPETTQRYRRIEQMIKTWIRGRRLDGTRWSIVRGEKHARSIVQTWFLPSGVGSPEPGLRNSKPSH